MIDGKGIEMDAIFFDCDGTLVDSEMLCSRAYVYMFAEAGIELDTDEVFKRFKGVKLYEIIDIINQEHGTQLQREDLEPNYRAEVARLFESELTAIPGAQELVERVSVPMCIVSNGPVSKMEHSLGNTGMLAHFTGKLFSGYDIQCWKPEPDIMFHAAANMGVDVTRAILVDDSRAGAEAGIAAGMQVYYFCADDHNPPITHPNVTSFTSLSELPALWRQRGWNLTKD